MSRAASNTTTAQFGQRFEIAMENRVEDVVNVRQLAVTATVVEVAPKASGDTRRRDGDHGGGIPPTARGGTTDVGGGGGGAAAAIPNGERRDRHLSHIHTR
jgi:hypothetical protein